MSIWFIWFDEEFICGGGSEKKSICCFAGWDENTFSCGDTGGDENKFIGACDFACDCACDCDCWGGNENRSIYACWGLDEIWFICAICCWGGDENKPALTVFVDCCPFDFFSIGSKH